MHLDTRWDSSGRVMNPLQSPIPTQDNTTQKDDDKQWCLLRDSNRRSQLPRDQDPRLSPQGHWDLRLLVLFLAILAFWFSHGAGRNACRAKRNKLGNRNTGQREKAAKMKKKTKKWIKRFLFKLRAFKLPREIFRVIYILCVCVCFFFLYLT
jgi:hypothetical protein